MSDSIVAGVERVERAFDGLGLGSGTFAPVARFTAGFVVGGFMMEAVRPEFAYTHGGRRPWAITDPNEANKTYIPWWAPGVGLGMLFGLFI
jgi:hypothetical protein